MMGAFGAVTATELAMPDFVALAASFGVDARATSTTDLASDLAAALARPGPSVVVLPQKIGLFAPTHLDRVAESDA